MPAVSNPTCFSRPHEGEIFSAQLAGKFKPFLIAGSLKLWRGVVNVYASITLIVAGIYCAPAPLGSIPALLCRFMGALQALLRLLLVFHFVKV